MKAMAGRVKRSGWNWQEAECPQGPDPARSVAFHGQGFIVGSRIPVGVATREHEEEGPQHLVSQADDSSFAPPAHQQGLELRLQGASGFGSGMGKLAQQPPDIGIAFPGASRSMFASRLVVAGADAHLGGQTMPISTRSRAAPITSTPGRVCSRTRLLCSSFRPSSRRTSKRVMRASSSSRCRLHSSRTKRWRSVRSPLAGHRAVPPSWPSGAGWPTEVPRWEQPPG